jgi:hypothetical protein
MLQVPDATEYLLTHVSVLAARHIPNLQQALNYNGATPTETIEGIMHLLTGKRDIHTALSNGAPDKLHQRIEALRSICLALLH